MRIELTGGVRDSVEPLFDHLINDERFDRESFVGESPDNKTAVELVDRIVDAMSPDPRQKCIGLEAGCRCWRCGQQWCEANYSKGTSNDG